MMRRTTHPRLSSGSTPSTWLSFLNLPAPLPCWGPQEGCADLLLHWARRRQGVRASQDTAQSSLFRLALHDGNYSPDGKAGYKSQLEVSRMTWCQHVGWWLQTLRKVRASEPYHWNQPCHHWALQQEIIGVGMGAVLD